MSPTPGSRRACLSLVTAMIALTGVAAPGASAHEQPSEEIVVIGRAQNLLTQTQSASQGVIGASDLAQRPILRAGELLEVVPGVAVTQHSGTGKANQFFLRGFNLDHGTDFSAHVDGVPLNQPTHGHGQGYLDLNPIIPEFVASIAFGKGPYYADVGDFSSAGYARYELMEHVHEPFVKLTGGEFDHYRGVAGASATVGSGVLLGGLEAQYYDGPWDLEEDADKLNVLLRYTSSGTRVPFGMTLTAYDADWTSTDQVPRRAVEAGLISPLGHVDPTLGGSATRYSANLALGDAHDGPFRMNAYAVYSDFELFSNFTYFLDDPVRGDQITQRDERISTGFNTAWRGDGDALGRPVSWVVGAQLRHDRIFDVALLRSRARTPLSTVREDEVAQTSLGVYLSGEMALGRLWKAQVGVRADRFWFDVDSSFAVNSGSDEALLVTPKLALVFGPWHGTEWFLNFGQGFHSNDARGALTRVDPATGDPAVPVDPLVRSTGVEGGTRVFVGRRLHSTLSLWYLELDSELLFVGDAGTTEASGASRRYGMEISNHWRAADWLTLELDVALTQSRFTGGGADEVPNSVGRVITGGALVDLPSGVFGSLRVRHFGDSPIVEDGSVNADATTVVNLRAGVRIGSRTELSVDVFNLFDTGDPDISYFFASCLRSDPAGACGATIAPRPGIEDVHLHPVEPRSVRASVLYRF